MASWMVHLRIAEGLLSLIPDLDAAQFAIGNVAPDSGLPDENWTNFNPPKTVTHFEIEGEEPLYRQGDMQFYSEHLQSVSPDDKERFSFLLGYFFHLLVDNLWILEVWRPSKIKYLSQFEDVSALGKEAKKDWYGLDFAYVRTHPHSLFWQVFLSASYDRQYLEYFSDIAIPKQLKHIKTFYQREDEAIEESLRLRDNQYLTEAEMTIFVNNSVKTLFEIYQKMWSVGFELKDQKSALALI